MFVQYNLARLFIGDLVFFVCNVDKNVGMVFVATACYQKVNLSTK